MKPALSQAHSLRIRQWSPTRRLGAVVYLWGQLVLLGWWATNFPVQVSADSITYMHHVTVGPWIANHSVLYDAIIGASIQLTGSVWLVTLVQTVVYAALLALVTTRVHRLGVRARWAALPALLIVLVPTFGSFVDMLWKDVPFAAANLLLTATVLQIIARRRTQQRALTWRTATALAAELTAVALFRNNGFIVVAIVALVLLIFLARDRLKVAAAAVAALAIFEFAGAVVYPAAGIRPVSSGEAYGVFYGDIAYVYSKDPGAFTPAGLAAMKAAAPLSHWAASNDCLYSDPLFRHHFNMTAADAHRHQLAALWFHLLTHDPVNLLEGHLCRASVAWRVDPTPQFSVLPRKSRAVAMAHKKHLPEALVQQLKPAPASWTAYHAATAARSAVATNPWLQVLFARAAGWTYLAYLAVLIAAFRNKWRMILLAATPIVANQLTVILANPAQLYRYTVVQLFLGMLLVPLVAARLASVRRPHRPTGRQTSRPLGPVPQSFRGLRDRAPATER
ncbi:hypothetical protein [Flexivirga lutea]